MKKIYLIPTDKPSRLSILNSGKLNFGAEIMSSSNSKPQNIYITNSEEIKEGDWYWLEKVGKIGTNSGYYKSTTEKSSKLNTISSNCKKIILTTDTDLIKDGVQEIHEDFLEWYVKNPSCEWVDVMTDAFTVKEMSMLPLGTRNFKYKIIIPKEESKQKCEYCKQPISKYGCACGKQIEEPKQECHICKHCGVETTQSDDKCYAKPETLEERKPYWDLIDKKAEQNNRIDLDAYANGVQDGAKWQQQQERMYSEEDMREAFFSGCHSERKIKPRIKCWEEFIEQFKKK